MSVQPIWLDREQWVDMADGDDSPDSNSEQRMKQCKRTTPRKRPKR